MTTDSPKKTWSTAEEEIMEASYRALLEDGYADLSISRIADELYKSKAAIYYHYDTKDGLLAAFLEFTVDRFKETIDTETGDDSSEDLELVTEKLLPVQPDGEHVLAIVNGTMYGRATPDRVQSDGHVLAGDEY